MSIVDSHILHLTTVNNTPKLAFCSSWAKQGARCWSGVATILNFQLILSHNQMLLTLILNKWAFCSYLLPYSCGAFSFTSSLAVESQNDIIECSYFFLLAQPSIRRFCKVFQKKFIKFLGWSLGSLNVYNSSPRLCTVPFFLNLSLMAIFVEL